MNYTLLLLESDSYAKHGNITPITPDRNGSIHLPESCTNSLIHVIAINYNIQVLLIQKIPNMILGFVPVLLVAAVVQGFGPLNILLELLQYLQIQ